MPRNDVTVRFRADTGQAKTELQRFGDNLRGLQSTIKNNLVGFGLLAGSVAGVGVSMKSFIDVAREQRNALATLQQVTNNTGFSFGVYRQNIMDTTAALQDSTNFGDEFQQRLLARMIPILGDVNQALAALPAVLDAATVSGKDASSVANTLTKALAGQANMAESVGLKFDAAAGFNERLAQTMAAVGGAAAANADPFEQLGNDFGDFKEEVGEFLIGPATGMVNWLRDAVQGYGQLGRAIRNTFSSLDEMDESIQDLIGGTDDSTEQLRILEDEFKRLQVLALELEQVVADPAKLTVSEFSEATVTLQETRDWLDRVTTAYNDLSAEVRDSDGATSGWNRTASETERIYRKNAQIMGEFHKRVNEATQEIREQERALAELNKSAEMQAIIDSINESLASDRLVREHIREGLNAGAAAILAEAEAARQLALAEEIAKSKAFLLQAQILELSSELEAHGNNIDVVTQIMQWAEEGAISWERALESLNELMPHVNGQIQEQQAEARKLASEYRAMAAAVHEAALAQAQFAGIGPTNAPINMEFITRSLSGMFGSFTASQRESLAFNRGVSDEAGFLEMMLAMVTGFSSTSLDRTEAIMRAVRQLEAMLPGFDNGGVVPGPIGAPQLAMVHGGETILPTHRSGGGGDGIHIHNDFAGATILGIDDLDSTIRQSVDNAMRRSRTRQGRR